MKLIEMLLTELPNRDRWPANGSEAYQDDSLVVYFLGTQDGIFTAEGMCDIDFRDEALNLSYAGPVTKSQYESALQAAELN